MVKRQMSVAERENAQEAATLQSMQAMLSSRPAASRGRKM